MKIFLIFLCLVVTRAFSQDYVVVGDTLKQGKVRRAGNQKLTLGYGSTLVEYPMSAVSEYRQGSSVYQSLRVDGDKRMYKRIADGDLSLYKGNHVYILKSNDQLVQLPRKGFRTTLANSIACAGEDKWMSNVSFSRMSLQRIVDASNKGSCTLKDLPHRTFGFMLSYGFMNMTAAATQTIHSTASTRTLSSILFFDAPLFIKYPWLYASIELFVGTSYKTDFVFLEPTQTTQMTTRMQSFTLAPGLKFVTAKGSAKPYIKLAPAISNTIFDSETGLRVKGTARDGQLVSAVAPDSYPQLGVSATVGIQVKIAPREDLHIEIRHISAKSNSNTQFEIGSKGTAVNLGMSF